LWAIDRTSDLTIWSIRTLQEDVTIMPKLFRQAKVELLHSKTVL
jgi:hypothetical protein